MTDHFTQTRKMSRALLRELKKVYRICIYVLQLYVNVLRVLFQYLYENKTNVNYNMCSRKETAFSRKLVASTSRGYVHLSEYR
jgi:hypothetical protein